MVDPGLLEHHATTHFGISDSRGNAVSLTYTLNDFFGCGQVVTGAGFLLNNEMDDFSVKPGVPNEAGVVGSAANAIAAGKQPLSTMSPTILAVDGRVAAVIGTPGGSRIATSIAQVLWNWRDFHLPLDAAMPSPASTISSFLGILYRATEICIRESADSRPCAAKPAQLETPSVRPRWMCSRATRNSCRSACGFARLGVPSEEVTIPLYRPESRENEWRSVDRPV